MSHRSMLQISLMSLRTAITLLAAHTGWGGDDDGGGRSTVNSGSDQITSASIARIGLGRLSRASRWRGSGRRAGKVRSIDRVKQLIRFVGRTLISLDSRIGRLQTLHLVTE
jgi:hypothetical protein